MKVMTASILLFAIAIGGATFIENDYGTPAAQVLIYKTKWFEFLLLLLTVNLIGNIFRMNLIRKEKFTILLFHVAFIVILLGSGVTRYISYEGTMHIREGDTVNEISSTESYISILAEYNGEILESHHEVLYTSITKASYSEGFEISGKRFNVEVTHFIPDAEEKLFDTEFGQPILSAVIGTAEGRKTIFLREHEARNIGGMIFSFEDLPDSSYVNIEFEDGKLSYIAPYRVGSMRMADMSKDTSEIGKKSPLHLRTLYDFNGVSIVFNDFKESSVVRFVPGGIKPKNEIQDIVVLKVSTENTASDLMLVGNKGRVGAYKKISKDGITISAAYGSKVIELPFAIQLNDFQLERYPGSNSPASYASEITLIDEKGESANHRIFMNNVLNHNGYRFFQSSYDPDELGTYLSVNHDFWGTWITYIGYSLLSLGMFLTVFSKHSRFVFISKKLDKIRDQKANTISVILLITMLSPFASMAQELPDSAAIDYDHAREFGRVMLQDHKGRLKPLNTFNSELVRKISGKDKLFGLHSDQIILGMIANPVVWQKLAIIKVDHSELQSILGIDGKLAAFNDLFSHQGYRLGELAEKANNTKPKERSLLDNEVIKVDERFNICYYVYINELFTVFPKPDDPNNKWYASAGGTAENFGDAEVFVKNYFKLYVTSLREAQQSKDWAKADETLGYLNTFQQKYGKAIFPAESKIDLEILYNEVQIFKKLRNYYGLIGTLLLIVLLVKIFNPSRNFKVLIITGAGLLIMLFLAHTAGLAVRWHISGHAPWSNGYESMIYIGWATMLAGFIFSRRSTITLAITAVLTFFILFVAGLNWLDPEITNLVPVLNSYWLMIHVSMITASYGFLALGCLLAFFNLILMIFTRKSNQDKTNLTLSELTYIIELTLTVGLFMLTIGMFLGGVWANESWGRYWGWDAKETWALVSVLIYSFIMHMRFVPPLSGKFAFNFASLIGFSAIVMTYFGVNYYLSGLHSYAAGDPVPIPTFVYYTIAVVFAVSALAYWNQRRLKKA